MSALELVHGERLDRHGDVLLLATGIGKAQVHELDLLVLDQFHDVIGRHCHCRISSGFGLLVSRKGNKALDRGISADSMPSGAKKAGHCAIREHSKRFRGLAHQTGAKQSLCAPRRCESTPTASLRAKLCISRYYRISS